MKLYEAPSPNSRRVNIALAEKGIEVERVAVDIRGGEISVPIIWLKIPADGCLC